MYISILFVSALKLHPKVRLYYICNIVAYSTWYLARMNIECTGILMLYSISVYSEYTVMLPVTLQR